MTIATEQKSFIEQELQKFNVVESKLKELAAAGTGLTIASIDDKKGIEVVKSARIAIKNERVRIEKTGKSLRDQANAFNKAVLAKEKEYLALIVPTEDALKAEEDRIENERLAIEQAKQEAERIRIQNRINDLAKYGHVIDFSLVSSMTDEQFNERLTEARISHENELKRIAEEKEAARIEAERLAAIAKEQAAERARMDAEAAKMRAEKEAHERELYLAKEKIRLEQESLERERQYAEKEKQRQAEQAERHGREILEAEARAKKQAEEAESAKAKAAEEREAEVKRQASLAPDKEKLTALAASLTAFELPELSNPDADKIKTNVKALLAKVTAYIHTEISKL